MPERASEKESREGGRNGERGFCVQRQEQVAIAQEKEGAFSHRLRGDLKWLESDGGFPLLPACWWSSARCSNAARDLVLKQKRGAPEGGRGTLALTRPA